MPAFASMTEQGVRGGWVYIMADSYRGTLYIGVTSHLAARAFAVSRSSTRFTNTTLAGLAALATHP